MYYICLRYNTYFYMQPALKVNDHSTIHFGRAAELLPRLLGGKPLVAVTDSEVKRCHAPLFADSLTLTVGRGEESKTLETVAALYRALMECGTDRTSFITGIGGGIVTDIAGFAAATYMRGIGFGFVPTTLLAQVDASVGGKNGVNVDGYKNMVGTFAQPQFVICDVTLLRTLPDREFRAGLAEALKAGIIADPELFGLLERNGFDTLRRDETLLEEVVYRALRVKADIVARDEREAGDRRLLNLGHTLAHAIEKCCPSQLNHGEAVAVGTMMVARAAVRMGVLAGTECRRIEAALTGLGFSLDVPADISVLLSAVARDKKSSGEAVWLVLPEAIGRCSSRLTPRKELPQLFAN